MRIKQNSNRNFSNLCRNEGPLPADSCSVCRIVGQTLTLWSQHPQLSSTTMHPDNVPNNGPMRQRMHRQPPEKTRKWFSQSAQRLWRHRPCTVVSSTSSTFGARTWMGRGSLAEAKIAPSLPSVMTTVRQPKHKKLFIARFASLE